MVEKETIIKEKVKYAGLGSFKNAYNHAHDWLRGEDFLITEDKYTEKVEGEAKDIDVNWSATKTLTDYFRMSLKVNWTILGMKEVKVEMNGKKKKMNEFGEVEISIKGTLEKDYDSKWETSAFQKFCKDVYNKYVIHGRTDQKRGDVAETVQAFKDEMKSFFELSGKR